MIAFAEPYEVFSFDLPAGMWRYGGPAATEKLLSGHTVQGRVKFDDCRVGEVFGAGFRIKFERIEKDAGLNFGFSCKPAQRQVLYSARSWGLWEGDVDSSEHPVGYPGEWIAFSMRIEDGVFLTRANGKVYRQTIPPGWDSAHFYAYCSNGRAEFYEPNEASS
ncbi:MAG: hypothetical protein AAGH90_11640 [Pseudomonadota bacterium]